MAGRTPSGDVRVVLVDGDAAARARVGALLAAEDGVVVVGETGSAERALYETLERRPDVVVLAEAGGAGPIRAVLEHGAQVVVLSARREAEAVRAALEAGARGYVLAESGLATAIHEVAGGGRYVDPAVGGGLIEAEAATRRRAQEDPLSGRQHEVLRLLVLGHTNREIARTLVVSVRTVETHRANIMALLGVANRAELVGHPLARRILAEERGASPDRPCPCRRGRAGRPGRSPRSGWRRRACGRPRSPAS